MPPPCCFTSPYTVASPSPVPFPGALVVKNGSNMRARVTASMPTPVSSTASQTCSPARSAPHAWRQGLELEARAPREAEQLLHHDAPAQGRRHHVAQIGVRGFLRRGDRPREQLRVGEDDREQVVEVVGDTARELADRLQLLRLP